MSNVSIIERIRTLAEQLEEGEITVEQLRDTLLGHVEALEGVNYDRIKEIHWVWAQLSNAISSGQQNAIDSGAVVGFLRQWTDLVVEETSN